LARFFRPISFGDIVACISLIALLTLQLVKFADDPGVGWHLQGGKFIAQSGHAPAVDPLLHSDIPRTWISDQWLSDLILYTLYNLGFWPLIYLVFILIYIGTYFAFLLKGTQHISGARIASVFAVFLAFKIGLVHFILRPVVFTFPLFVLLVVFTFSLYRHIKSVNLDKLPSKAWLLPFLFLLWTNIHPSFLLGLGFLSLLPLALFLDGIFFKAALLKNRKIFIQLLALFALCSLVTFINPYAWRLHKAIISLLSSEFFANLYEEWRSPNFKELPGTIVIFTLAVIAISAFLGGALKWGFFELLCMISFSALALQASRNLPFFGIAMCIPLAEALNNFGNIQKFSTLPVFRLLRKPMARIELREARAFPPLLLISLVVALVAVYSVRGKVMLYDGFFGPSPSSYPYQAMTRIPKGSVVASTLGWGGFIVFHCDIKAIIDDRSTVLGEEFYREYFRRMTPSSDWKQYLKERGATHLLLPPDSPIALVAERDGYTLLHKDQTSALYLFP